MLKVPACFSTHPAIAQAYRLGYADAASGKALRSVSHLPAVIAVAYVSGGMDAAFN